MSELLLDRPNLESITSLGGLTLEDYIIPADSEVTPIRGATLGDPYDTDLGEGNTGNDQDVDP